MPEQLPPLPTAPAPARHRARALVVGAAVALALLVTLSACGDDGGSSSNPAPTAGPGAGRGFIAQDPKVRACLQKQGVTLPDRSAAGRRFRGGPPTGTNAQPPTGTNGQRPPRARGRPGGFRRDPAQFAKLQAALKKCGVTAPARGQGGPRQQAAPTTTTAAS